MLQQGREQDVSEFTNFFHTLSSKLGIKDTEQHLVLKYRGCLHKYIQEEIIYPRSTRHTDTLSRSSKSLNRRSETLDLQIQSKGKVPPNHITKDKAKAGRPKTTCQSYKQRTVSRSWKRTRDSGVSSIRAPLTAQVSVGPSNDRWPS